MMRSVPLLLAFVACDAADPAAPASDAALPDDLAGVAYAEFAFSQLVPGFPAGGAWAFRTPGSRVWFFATSGGTGAGPCFPAGSPCLDLAGSVQLLGSARTGRDGVANWAAVLPPRIPAGPWSFQAVERRPDGTYEVSDVVSRGLGYVACPAVWAPVCAADHDTYGNSCEAEAYGWPVLFSGTCP